MRRLGEGARGEGEEQEGWEKQSWLFVIVLTASGSVQSQLKGFAQGYGEEAKSVCQCPDPPTLVVWSPSPVSGALLPLGPSGGMLPHRDKGVGSAGNGQPSPYILEQCLARS